MLLADALSPPIHAGTLVTAWQHDPLSLVAWVVEALVLGAYLVGVRRLRERGRRWSPWRTASFVGGIIVIVISIGSGLAAYDDTNFTAHVIQHVLLMNLAPVLLALGAPITLALQASQRSTTTRILKVLHSVPARILTHPLVAASVGIVTMYAYFLSPLYKLSLHNQLFHDYVHLHFLIAGCLYWWPLVGRDVLPRRWGFGAKFVLLFVAIPWSSFLGVAITGMSHPLVSRYTLADTHTGGGVLWAATELFTVLALTVIFVDWARAEEREALRKDREFDAVLAARQAGAGVGTVDNSPAVPAPASGGGSHTGG